MSQEDFNLETLDMEENLINDSDGKPEDNNSTIDKKRFLKNIIIVIISNLISVLSGILIGFIIPKIMGVSEYGYYKTFTLYSSYIGILHFGFIDGIYLKFAGKKYEELDKCKFRTYTRFLMLMELIVSAIILSLSFFFIKSSYFLIVLFVSLSVLATNITTYFEFISQITMRFKRTTARNIFRCTLNIISVLTLYFLYKFNNFVVYNYTYVITVLVIQYILALWYVISYKDIVLGEGNKIKEEKSDLISFFKVGVPLLLANLVGQLVFVADQQVVNVAFDNDTYATYAFAYNMISIITIATSAISVVLYPTLKSLNEKSVSTNYSKLNSYLLIFVSFCLIAYFFLDVIVRVFLDKYVDSLLTFRIILPGVLISSSISVIKYNCYKKFGLINNYFIKSLIVLVLSIIANIIVYIIFRNTISISIVSIFVLLIWYIIVEMYFVKNYKVAWVKNIVYLLLILSSFYLVMLIPNIYISGIVYLVCFIVITLCLYYKLIKEIFNSVISIIKRKRNKQVSWKILLYQ